VGSKSSSAEFVLAIRSSLPAPELFEEA